MCGLAANDAGVACTLCQAVACGACKADSGGTTAEGYVCNSCASKEGIAIQSAVVEDGDPPSEPQAAAAAAATAAAVMNPDAGTAADEDTMLTAEQLTQLSSVGSVDADANMEAPASAAASPVAGSAAAGTAASTAAVVVPVRMFVEALGVPKQSAPCARSCAARTRSVCWRQ